MPPRSEITRFWKKVEITNSCWIWKGTTGAGYGQYTYKAKRYGSHRFAYELLEGKIPEGWEIHHLCENKLCVNPAHLQIVTVRDHRAREGELHRKDYCKWGHLLSEENIYIYRLPTRLMVQCRICSQIRKKSKR